MTSAASLTLPIHIAELALVVCRSRFEQSRCGQGTRARADRASVPRMKSILGQSPQPNQAVGFSRWRPVAKSPFSRRGAHTLLAVGLLASTLLTGCSSTPAPTPTPTALIAGKFATEEEALAAAKEVYLKYAALSEQLSLDPGSDSAQLREITSADLYSFEIATADAMLRNNVTAAGSVNYWGFVFDSFSGSRINIKFCADNSGARLFDSGGTDVTDDTDQSIVEYVAAVNFGAVGSTVISLDPTGGTRCDG